MMIKLLLLLVVWVGEKKQGREEQKSSIHTFSATNQSDCALIWCRLTPLSVNELVFSENKHTSRGFDDSFISAGKFCMNGCCNASAMLMRRDGSYSSIFIYKVEKSVTLKKTNTCAIKSNSFMCSGSSRRRQYRISGLQFSRTYLPSVDWLSQSSRPLRKYLLFFVFLNCVWLSHV